MPAREPHYGPLMKRSEWRALPHEEKHVRAKEFYGAAWRDRCDTKGGAHSCQNPQEHQEAYDYLKSEHEKSPPEEKNFLNRPDIRKALDVNAKHTAPDFVGAATDIGGPLSDFHGYTNGKQNPNPWPATEEDVRRSRG